jgi:hypothetical protein
MWDELRRPATLIAIVLAIVSVLFGGITSLYFYKKGERFGRVAFDVEQIQIFDKTRMGAVPLTVLDASGAVIDNNVYAANVTIWNSGNDEIKKADVREPFRIIIEGNPKIIDCVSTFYTRNNVDKFTVDRECNISWNHFDSGEGFEVSILYVGDTIRPIKITGYAINIKKTINYLQIKELIHANDIIFYKILAIIGNLFIYLALIIGLCIIIFTNRPTDIVNMWNIFRQLFDGERRYPMVMFTVCFVFGPPMAVIGVVGLIWGEPISSTPRPF